MSVHRKYRHRINGLRQFVAVLRLPFLADAERRTPIRFEGRLGGRSYSLLVEPTDAVHGLATLLDGDVLMVLATVLAERLDNDEPLHAPVEITCAELLSRLDRRDDGRQRDLLLAEIARLAASLVHTDLRGTPQSFRLIEDFYINGTGDTATLHFTLPIFLVDEVAKNRVLDIDPGALSLSSLARRVHGWARACVGRDPAKEWTLDYPYAHALSAREDEAQGFARAMRDLIMADPLPGYALVRGRRNGQRCLRITPRSIVQRPPTSEAVDVFESQRCSDPSIDTVDGVYV